MTGATDADMMNNFDDINKTDASSKVVNLNYLRTPSEARIPVVPLN